MRSCLLVAACLAAAPAFAQSTSIAGNLSALVDHLPNVPRAGSPDGTAAVTELRLRAIADLQIEAAPWLRFRFAGVADALTADRGGRVTDASADALEGWIEFAGARADVRAGFSRLAWGRLDEVQPTDVVNPIDVSRFLLEGRSDARIAVPMLRARFMPSGRLTVEAVMVPDFRPGRFDRLEEATSPFNLLRDLPAPPPCPPNALCGPTWSLERIEPGAGEIQGGARLSVTTGRVDWSVSGWRGFVPFALLNGPLSAPRTLHLEHPRYTMLGGDFETVVGRWAIRGEAAFFPDRPIQVENQARWFEGNAVEAGAGIDRRAGDFTLSGTVLFRRTVAFTLRPVDPDSVGGRTFTDIYAKSLNENVSLVAGFSRTFNRDRVETRLFSLLNPEDRAAFARGLFVWKPVDDLALESSIGWFIGDGDDVITQFGERDFAYLRVKYYFGR